jgi:hypothetical protein
MIKLRWYYQQRLPVFRELLGNLEKLRVLKMAMQGVKTVTIF